MHLSISSLLFPQMNNYTRLFICSWLEKISVIRRGWGIRFSICTDLSEICNYEIDCSLWLLSPLAALFRSSFCDSNLLSSALSNQTLTNPHSGSINIARTSVLLHYKSVVLSLVFPVVNYVKNCVQERY